MEWNWLAAPSLLALLTSWGLAGLVYWTRPEISENRRLAFLLVLEGIVIFSLNGGAFLFTSRDSVHVLFAIGTLAVGAKPSAYLNFLATLDSPYVAPLRTRTGRWALLAAAVAPAVLWFLMPQAFLAGVVRADYAAWSTQPGYLLRPLALILAVLYLMGLAFAYSALRRARSQQARARTRAYVVAFLVRDLLFAVWAVAFLIVPFGHALWPHIYVSIAFMPLVFVPVVVYGILRSQLFRIDLRLKWTVRQGTVASAFGFVFIVASETIEQLLPIDGALIGLAFAVLLTIGFRPLHKIADRISERLFPGVADVPAYHIERAEVIYRTAVEGVLRDGQRTEREESLLERLRQELSIPDERARLLEMQATTGDTGR